MSPHREEEGIETKNEVLQECLGSVQLRCIWKKVIMIGSNPYIQLISLFQ